MDASCSTFTAAKQLKFGISEYSSYSYSYVAENVLVDNPADQSSRWSSDSNNPPQFIILKLERPAILHSIKFGKYEKTHVCNLKKFKVYGGMTEEHLIELLDHGLKNDHVPETFNVRNRVDGNHFPCRYVKIVPIQAWGPSFNFSIWYVELHGVDDWQAVLDCMNWYNLYREREAIRLCLKHFRQRHYVQVFQELSKKTKVSLEHPLLTELHDLLVVNGDYEKCEEVVKQACHEGLFDQYLSHQRYTPLWTPIQPVSTTNKTACDTRPGMRGGHQMCMDTDSEMIYLFAGWDGNTDLADFWSFHMLSREWTCLSKNTEEEGGPCARSCHKICLDSERKQIFTLGRYLEPAARTDSALKSDFYMYDIASDHWTLITDDTFAMGGPMMIFDHQMTVDVEHHVIYVFGGRILSSPTEIESASEQVFSGLYSYHSPSNTWTKLLDDRSTLRSRIGHSMLFHPRRRMLYIFAGQRSKEYLNDFYSYNIDSGTVHIVSDSTDKESCQAGFTQRATIDADLDEIHVLSGLSRDKDRRDNVKNSLWVYEISKDKWTCVYKNENSGQHYWTKMQHVEPVPRFAHQLVYDHKRKKHYLFGGNPGKDSLPKMRLDDFWSLQLSRPSQTFLLRKCIFLIRKFHFLELASSDTCSAMSYLQTSVYNTIDKEDPKENQEFQLLTRNLFKAGSPDNDTSLNDGRPGHFHRRTELFDQLASFFPDSMTQPRGNLIDLIPVTGNS